PLLVVAFRGLAAVPRDPRWLGRSAVVGGAVVFALALLLHVRSVVADWPLLTEHFEPLVLVWGIPAALERPALFLLGVALVVFAVLRLGTGARLGYLMVGAGVGYQCLMFGISQWEAYRQAYRKDYADMMFVRDFLRHEPTTSAEPPTVYWPTE